jgi:hypothetical protein
MTALVGAAVLIIIAVAVFLFALGVLRRQVGQQRAVTGESVDELVAVPVQEFSANYPGTDFPLTSDDVQSNNGRGLGDLNRESQRARDTHQFVPQHADFMSQDSLVFATEPVPTEHISELSTPDATRLPSAPVSQQQEIPSTPTTPTDLWEVPMGEIVTDPVLEAMMHEAQAGLYVIPEREDKPEA